MSLAAPRPEMTPPERDQYARQVHTENLRAQVQRAAGRRAVKTVMDEERGMWRASCGDLWRDGRTEIGALRLLGKLLRENFMSRVFNGG